MTSRPKLTTYLDRNSAAAALGLNVSTLYRRAKRNPDVWGPDSLRQSLNGPPQPLWSKARIAHLKRKDTP